MSEKNIFKQNKSSKKQELKSRESDTEILTSENENPSNIDSNLLNEIIRNYKQELEDKKAGK